ncbi:MAG TPA: chromosomal replication initiator protein DnaA [Candidatus Paceibacterota bacterium]|nr:chromosomal replication initiator protein DnaA [Candidatus Paceibacterota bacterium]
MEFTPGGDVNPDLTFERFVTGKSSERAYAAAHQVAKCPGHAHNPLFIYGGAGCGKTHLLHAIGNGMLQERPGASVLYRHAERFVAEVDDALQHNTLRDKTPSYRSADALLIDDIQCFAGREQPQEEFFHTFMWLLENDQQVVVTCDRFPKELDGLEARLRSRFNWGLTVALAAPELETRVAILRSKAQAARVELPGDVARYMAKHLRSGGGELDGALRRLAANAHFVGAPITLDFAKAALSDLLPRKVGSSAAKVLRRP